MYSYTFWLLFFTNHLKFVNSVHSNFLWSHTHTHTPHHTHPPHHTHTTHSHTDTHTFPQNPSTKKHVLQIVFTQIKKSWKFKIKYTSTTNKTLSTHHIEKYNFAIKNTHKKTQKKTLSRAGPLRGPRLVARHIYRQKQTCA